MGFMDKVKAQAEQAVVKAQHGVAQGQVKLETFHAGRNADAVLRELGRAFYARQRTGGSLEEVRAALAAVDAHVAANGPIEPGAATDVAEAPDRPAADPAAPAPAPVRTSPAPPPAVFQSQPSGYNLDDL